MLQAIYGTTSSVTTDETRVARPKPVRLHAHRDSRRDHRDRLLRAWSSRILGRSPRPRPPPARTQIELLGLGLDNYRLDNGSYPTTEQGLAALEEKRP